MWNWAFNSLKILVKQLENDFHWVVQKHENIDRPLANYRKRLSARHICVTAQNLLVYWSKTAFSGVHSIWVNWRDLMSSKRWIRTVSVGTEVTHGMLFGPGVWVFYHWARARKVAILCVLPFLLLSKIRGANICTSENMHYEDEESLQGNVIRLSTVCERSLAIFKSAIKIVLIFYLLKTSPIF